MREWVIEEWGGELVRPLFLDADCNVVFEGTYVGNSVYAGDEIVEERQEALIDQSECVADFEDDVFGTTPDNPVLMFVSHHGGDSVCWCLSGVEPSGRQIDAMMFTVNRIDGTSDYLLDGLTSEEMDNNRASRGSGSAEIAVGVDEF